VAKEADLAMAGINNIDLVNGNATEIYQGSQK